MRNCWLFIGLMALFIHWIPSVCFLLVFLLWILVYYVRHYRLHIFFFVMLLICIIGWWNQPSSSMPVSKIMKVDEIRANYLIAKTEHEKVLVYGIDNANFDDVIEVKGIYQPVDTIHNINEFNFTSWLQRRNITFQIQAKEYSVLEKGTSFRHHLFAYIQKMHQKKRTWISAMLFQIQKEDVTFFITATGMHLSFLAAILEKMLNRKFSKRNSFFISFLFLGCVGYCTLFSTSLIRILCFRFVRFVFNSYGQADKLGISMFIIVTIFPYMAFEFAFLLPIGFQLISIFSVQKRNKTICGFLFLIPMQYIYYHSCNLVQILLFRFLRIVYAILYLTSWLMLILPFSFLYTISQVVYGIVGKMENLGFIMYYTPSFIWLMFWGGAVLNYLSKPTANLKLLCLLCLFTPFASYFDPFGEIIMIDVGQGDCTLIKLPFHQGVMLVDVMGSLYKNIPEDIIVPILKSKGIHSLDKVILTHADYDHSGGLKELKQLIDVKEVIDIKEKDTNLGPLHIPFLLPEYQGKDENDNSIITYLEVYGIRMLLMGDAGVDAEKAIIEEYPNLQVDIIKVGHHGSNTSSSLEFLHQIEPKLALISAGRNNRYGHPHKEITDRLKDENVYSLVTSKNGGVSIKFCKYFAFFRTADNEFGIIDFG